MNDISTEQLSAYLDDALPPAERAAVEEALAESPGPAAGIGRVETNPGLGAGSPPHGGADRL
jgi:anti-sigma factor RsiW